MTSTIQRETEEERRKRLPGFQARQGKRERGCEGLKSDYLAGRMVEMKSMYNFQAVMVPTHLYTRGHETHDLRFKHHFAHERQRGSAKSGLDVLWGR